ncbi:MAG: hypothetical protein Q9162_007319 [Coniocarpon cinnabarinum]
MRCLISAIALASMSAVSAQQQESICDKYTTALLKENNAANQYTLLTLLVNTAGIGNFTGPGTQHEDLPGSMVNVPGILAPGVAEGEQVNLLPYFSGALKSTNRNGMPTSVNFVDGGGAEAIMANPTSAGAPGSNQERLFTHLYQYFGKLLGCSHYGQMGFSAYMGGASMYNVHKYMDLDHAQNTWFIQQVGLAAKSFGASDDDIMTVANTLDNAFNYRCSPATELVSGQGAQLQSICQNQTCPLDPQSQCAAYPDDGMVSAPAPASMSTGMGGAMTSSQPASQFSDNHPQVPKMAGTPVMSPAMPAASPARYTGAAAAVNVLPAVVGGAAGLAAVLI